VMGSIGNTRVHGRAQSQSVQRQPVVKLLGKTRRIPTGAILPSRVVDLSKKLPDLNCEVQDPLLELVDPE